MKLKTITVPLVLGVLSALSPAPIFDKHAPSAISPEASQEQLSSEQRLARTQDVVGSVPIDMSQETNSQEQADGSAATMLRSAQNQVTSPESVAKTVNVLKTAEQDVENSKPAPMRTLFWILFASCFGYGVFFCFRRWADKNIPDSTSTDQPVW